MVSAIVSTYNSEKFIRGCLDDLIGQTLYQKDLLEIVVVNSGSRQKEENIVKEYQNKYKNIKYLKTERETIYQAWNRGIKAASGKYITNANTDDRHRNDALEILANALDSDDGIGLVYADQFVTKIENQIFGKHTIAGYFKWPEFDRMQLIHCACIGPQPMWRKSLHDNYGYFDERLKVAGDYEWWLRLSQNVRFKHIPEKLGLYLLSDSSVEHRFTNEMRNETNNLRGYYAQKVNLKSLDYLKYKPTFLILSYNRSLVTVIIPTFNRMDKLKTSIDSVLLQTYSNIEIIVINDAGKDISGVINSFNDNRIKLFNHENNKGLAAARNTGIKAANGQYIAFLDDDDIFYPNHLETALNNLNENNKVIYTDAVRKSFVKVGNNYILQSETVPYSVEFNRNKLLIGNIAPVNCFVFEKSLVEKTGLMDESLPVLEDWDFWLRLSEFTEFKHVKENTVQVNWYNDGSTMTSSKAKDFDETRKKIYKKYESEINNIPNKNEIIEEFNSIWRKDFNINMPIVSIIALSYNQLEYTKSFVDSVVQYTCIPFELILIDNGSNKDTVDYLISAEEKDKRIKTIFNEKNLGFPAAVNQGLKNSSGKYILIANNDIVVTEGWLERMLVVAESDEKIGVVGPVSNAVSGVQFDKDAKYPDIKSMHEYARKVKEKNLGQIEEFPRAAFLCTLIKKKVINKLGGLDERFSPGNYEDDDYCLRAQLAGFKTVIAKDVFIHHYGSKSFAAEGAENYEKRLETNRKIFVDKWGGTPEEIWLKGKQIKGRNIMITLNKNEFIENLERALSLIEEKDYQAAIRYLNTAVDTYDHYSHEENEMDLTYLLNLAGNVSMLDGNIDEARKYFEKALNLDPASSLACSGLGDVLYVSGNYDAARTMYEWGLKNDPSNKAASEGLSKVEMNSRLPENSNNSSIEINTGSENHTDKLIEEAYELFNDSKFNEALNKINIAEGLFNGQLSNPTDVSFAASFHNMKGFIYLGLNDIEKAKECFEKALKYDSKSSQACAGLGEILYLTEQDEQSKTMFEWAVKNNPDNLFAVGGLKKINNLLGYPDDHSSLNESSDGMLPADNIQITHRDELPGLFNALGLLGKGVEIGVQEGIFSKTLRTNWNGEELYLIDRWKYDPEYKDIANVTDSKQKEFYLSVIQKFADDSSVQILRKDSLAAVNQFPDNYFDWIYIDADHSFEGCTKDLDAWYSKLKPGGVFAGHDYIDGEFTAGSFGVKSAVDNFVKNKEVNLFITDEQHWKSWYFVKPGSSTPEISSHVSTADTKLSEEESKKLDTMLNEILESAFDLFGLKYFDEAVDTLEKTKDVFYSQNNNELIASYENLLGFNYLALDKKDFARQSFETALSINPQSSQACAGLGELFYLDGKDKEAKTMYEYAVKNNPDNMFAVGGLERINKLLGLAEDNNSLIY